MQISLHQGDIHTATTAAIVDPTDAAGLVGEATLQSVENASYRFVIIAPTMKHPAEPIPPKQVELATVAALRCADESGVNSIALPPFGTQYGQVDLEVTAKIMMETIQMFRSDQALQCVEIWLPDAAAVGVFQRYAL